MEQLVPLGHAVGTGWSTPCRWGIMSATWFVCVYKRHLKKMEPRRQRRQSSIVKLETRPLTSFTSRVDQLQRRKSVPLGSSGQADPEKKRPSKAKRSISHEPTKGKIVAKKVQSKCIRKRSLAEDEEILRGVFPGNKNKSRLITPNCAKEVAKRSSSLSSSKSVRIDSDVQVLRFSPGYGEGNESRFPSRGTLIRSESFENASSLSKPRFQRNLGRFFPRRRFSQSAIETIRELFEEVGIQSSSQDQHQKQLVQDCKDVRRLSKDEIMSELEKRRSSMDLPDYPDWTTLRSLTGKNVSGWKFQDNFYGHIQVGRRPSMDTAWGRRIYDQYEIELNPERPRNKFLGEFDRIKAPQELGLWDLIFNPEIIPKLEGYQQWDPMAEEKRKEIRKLKIDPSKLNDDLVINDEPNDPISQFKKRFMKTGEYLRPSDMKFCIENTNYTEEQIIDWFKRFKQDCPDGRLTKDRLRFMFKRAFPDGNGERFSSHILRIFDSDGNGFLDFKEFLLAMDISQCETEESKLKWAFKLFDFDNSGCIEIKEMISIMETLESLECAKHKRRFRKISYDESGNPVPVPTAEDRARDLFAALDTDRKGYLTIDKFMEGYMERNSLIARQDANEQKRYLDSLILKSFLFPDPDEVEDKIAEDPVKALVASMISQLIQVDCHEQDLDLVSFRAHQKSFPNNDEGIRRSVFVRFAKKDIRMQVWLNRAQGKKNGIVVEEYLTPLRRKLWVKCKELKAMGMIKDVVTRRGNVIVLINFAFEQIENDEPKYKLKVVTDTHFENLMRLLKRVDDGGKWRTQLVTNEEFDEEGMLILDSS